MAWILGKNVLSRCLCFMSNISLWNLLLHLKRNEQTQPKKIVINVRQSLQKVIIIEH